MAFTLETDGLVLRDFRESDIEARVRWETRETEWQLWDAPWDYEDFSEADRAANLERYVSRMHEWARISAGLAPDAPRSSLQIETRDGLYVGWVGSYHVDGGYDITEGTGACAVGISIPEPSARGHCYSYQALGAFIGYLMGMGGDEVLTQTWSGNLRMIHVAERMGFVECCRKPGQRLVRGERFDGLTFCLDRGRFEAFRR